MAKKMKRDIFISYRRQGGYETAKHLYDLLSRDGYAVSFDIDTLRNGDFDTELLKRIDECTDFIVILNRGAFDRCIDATLNPTTDWLRNELAYALKQNKNVIPVMLNGFTVFPDNLPEDIARVQRRNGPKYDQYYFDDFYSKLKSTFLETPEPKKCPTAPAVHDLPLYKLKVLTDLKCSVYIDEEYKGTIEEGGFDSFELTAGDYMVECSSDWHSGDIVRQRVSMTQNRVIEVNLQTVTEERLARENEALSKAGKRYHAVGVEGFQCRRLRVCLNGLWGFIDDSLKEVIPLKYSHAIDFKNGIAEVKQGGKYGIIDTMDRVVAPFIYDEFQGETGFFPVGEGQAIRCKTGGKWGLLNLDGAEIHPVTCDMISDFTGDYAVISLQGKYGLLHISGEEVVAPGFDSISSIENGYFVVKRDGKRGLWHVEKGEVIPCIYDDVYHFHDGLAPVQSGGKWGFVDKSGQVVIDLQYDDAQQFASERAAVKSGDKWGFVDLTGKMAIPQIYDGVHPMIEGRACVKVGELWGAIDINGKKSIAPLYEQALPSYSKNGYILCRNQGGVFWIDKYGEKGFFDSIDEEAEGVYAGVIDGDEYYFIEGLGIVSNESNEFLMLFNNK